MNDRLLFRGKTIDGVRPHFVTGHYVSTPRPMIVSDKPKIGGGWDFDDVDPATIGQCTGLRAAKSYRGESEADRLIFEGDVLKQDEQEHVDGAIHVVYWDRNNVGWFVTSRPLEDPHEIYEIEPLSEISEYGHICGTIHDRTEGEG